MKLIVKLLQSRKIGFAGAPDLYRGRIARGICSGHQVSYDGAPMFASSSAIAHFRQLKVEDELSRARSAVAANPSEAERSGVEE
jgi:hypothetical protein